MTSRCSWPVGCNQWACGDAAPLFCEYHRKVVAGLITVPVPEDARLTEELVARRKRA